MPMAVVHIYLFLYAYGWSAYLSFRHLTASDANYWMVLILFIAVTILRKVREGNKAQKVIRPTAQISEFNRTFFFFSDKTC